MATWGQQIGDVAVRALLHRIGVAVSLDVTILLMQAANPEASVNAHLRHLTAERAAAKRSLAVMLADAALLQRRMVQHQAEAVQWQARAERALQAGDARLARQALARKLHTQRIAGQYADADAAQQRSLAQVYTAIGQLEARIGEVRSARAQFPAVSPMQPGTMAWQRVAQAAHAPPHAPRDQSSVDAQFAKLELDQAMDVLRRTVQSRTMQS